MGVEASYTATITKRCDGCGVSYVANCRFTSVSALLSFGGPVEAATWQVRTTEAGAHLLCDLCVEHQEERP